MMRFSLCVLGAFLVGSNAVLAANGASRPNVLMIIVDDLNAQVGCFDGPAITPHIDQLSSQGVQFNNAYAACPSCNPSRTALFTGQRPENSGVFNNSQHFRESSPAKSLTTLPQLLKANGYNTIAAGKIFHNRRGTRPQPSPLSDPISWTYQPGIESGLFFGPNFKEQFHQPDGLPKWVLNTRVKVDEKDRKALKSTWVYGPIDVEPTNTLDFNTAEFGAAWLTGDMSDPKVAAAPRPSNKPFFLACGIFRPHIPILAPTEFFDLYTKAENKHRLNLPDLPADDIADLPKAAPAGKHWYVKYLKPWPAEQRNLRHAYLAATSYADAAVGIILDGLQKSGYAENTIVILMGDHGYQLGEKDRLGKSAVWRGASRTPLIIKMPDGQTGKTDQAVSLIDIFPTLTAILGLKAPQPLDGTSLVPLLEDPASERDTPAVISSTSGRQIGVVHYPWHYISYDDGSAELYDHSVDPSEITNLLAVEGALKKHQNVVKRLAKHVPANRK